MTLVDIIASRLAAVWAETDSWGGPPAPDFVAIAERALGGTR